MPREDIPWHESDDPDRIVNNLFWRTVGYVLLGLMVAAVISGVWFWVSVGTSGVKGTGDIERQNNSSNNRIAQQGYFEDLYAAIKSDNLKINQAAENVNKHPGDTWYEQVLTGTENQCITDTNQYNADAGKILAKDWISSDVPSRIDLNDPATDCQPDK